MIIFNKEIEFNYKNLWQVKDEDGVFFFQFKLFTIEFDRCYIGVILCNFGIAINWY